MDYSTDETACWREVPLEPSYATTHAPVCSPSLPPVPDFEAVYLKYFAFVCSVLRRLEVREQDLPDVSQHVFIVVFTKLPQFEQRSTLRTWIFRICLNAARDYRRAAPKRREVATEPAELDWLFGSRDDVHERSEKQRRVGQAERILNRLPKARREVFVLYELEQRSGQEIAEMLGIALGTVRSRLRLAREFFTREAQRLAVQSSRRDFEVVPRGNVRE